ASQQARRDAGPAAHVDKAHSGSKAAAAHEIIDDGGGIVGAEAVVAGGEAVEASECVRQFAHFASLPTTTFVFRMGSLYYILIDHLTDCPTPKESTGP